MKKLKYILKRIFNLLPDNDPDEYGKRKYRAKKDQYLRYK